MGRTFETTLEELKYDFPCLAEGAIEELEADNRKLVKHEDMGACIDLVIQDRLRQIKINNDKIQALKLLAKLMK